MKIILKKSALKYLAKATGTDRTRLDNALDGLASMHGDIQKLSGGKNEYRLKIFHFRILFTLDKETQVIKVTEINTRTNIKY